MHQDNMNTEWQEFWTKQSKIFCAAMYEQWKNAYTQQQIELWLQGVKQQWLASVDTFAEEPMKQYWQNLVKLNCEAADTVLEVWLKRTKNKDEMASPEELYTLWIETCNALYATHSNDMLRATMKWWK
jgi:hypothetical protein